MIRVGDFVVDELGYHAKVTAVRNNVLKLNYFPGSTNSEWNNVERSADRVEKSEVRDNRALKKHNLKHHTRVNHPALWAFYWVIALRKLQTALENKRNDERTVVEEMKRVFANIFPDDKKFDENSVEEEDRLEVETRISLFPDISLYQYVPIKKFTSKKLFAEDTHLLNIMFETEEVETYRFVGNTLTVSETPGEDSKDWKDLFNGTFFFESVQRPAFSSVFGSFVHQIYMVDTVRDYWEKYDGSVRETAGPNVPIPAQFDFEEVGGNPHKIKFPRVYEQVYSDRVNAFPSNSDKDAAQNIRLLIKKMRWKEDALEMPVVYPHGIYETGVGTDDYGILMTKIDLVASNQEGEKIIVEFKTRSGDKNQDFKKDPRAWRQCLLNAYMYEKLTNNAPKYLAVVTVLRNTNVFLSVVRYNRREVAWQREFIHNFVFNPASPYVYVDTNYVISKMSSEVRKNIANFPQLAVRDVGGGDKPKADGHHVFSPFVAGNDLFMVSPGNYVWWEEPPPQTEVDHHDELPPLVSEDFFDTTPFEEPPFPFTVYTRQAKLILGRHVEGESERRRNHRITFYDALWEATFHIRDHPSLEDTPLSTWVIQCYLCGGGSQDVQDWKKWMVENEVVVESDFYDTRRFENVKVPGEHPRHAMAEMKETEVEGDPSEYIRKTKTDHLFRAFNRAVNKDVMAMTGVEVDDARFANFTGLSQRPFWNDSLYDKVIPLVPQWRESILKCMQQRCCVEKDGTHISVFQ